MFHWLKLIVYFPICLLGYAKSNILFDAAKTTELKPNSRTYFLMKTSEISFGRSNMSKSYCIKSFGGVIFILMVILCFHFIFKATPFWLWC